MLFLLIVRRIDALLRTCFPADRSSWLLLLGSTFLFISHGLRWWSQPSSYSYGWLLWAGASTSVISAPMVAAGITGCYLGFVGFKNPARRLLDSVLLPAAIGLLATLIMAFYWFRDGGAPG